MCLELFHKKKIEKKVSFSNATGTTVYNYLTLREFQYELDPLEPIHSPLFPSFPHQTNPPRLELDVFDFAPPPLSLVSACARAERALLPLESNQGRPLPPSSSGQGREEEEWR